MNEEAANVDNEKAARDWLTEIAKHHSSLDGALVIGLSGHLGAGKTAFVKSVGKLLDVKETITSPTFVIMKKYDIEPGDPFKGFPWKRLVHIDAYRLEKSEGMAALGWESLVADKDNLIMVEWPENVRLEELGEKMRMKFEIKDGAYTIQ